MYTSTRVPQRSSFDVNRLQLAFTLFLKTSVPELLDFFVELKLFNKLGDRELKPS